MNKKANKAPINKYQAINAGNVEKYLMLFQKIADKTSPLSAAQRAFVKSQIKIGIEKGLIQVEQQNDTPNENHN
jgi:hypothetical protein